MKYYIDAVLEKPFEEVEVLVREELKKVGFGVLTEIDISEKMNDKLNVDFRNYKILGACNPPFAFEALKLEDKVGTLLPCNVIIQQLSNNKVEVAVIDPTVSMESVENKELLAIAKKVQCKLKIAIKNISKK